VLVRDFLRRRGDAIQIALGVPVTAAAAVDMIGRPARLVSVLALGAGMFAAGLGLGRIVERKRQSRIGSR
jgi:hypothetical protein